MFEKLKRSWRNFKTGTPGERFQEQFKRRRQVRQSPLLKFLFIAGGLLIMAGGLIFLPAPGPGIIILFIGAAMVARESLLAARSLDWIEVRLRRLFDGSIRIWRRSPLHTKFFLVLAAATCIGAVGVGAWGLIFSR